MEDSSHPDTIVTINCVINALLSVLSITGNTLVLVTISGTHSLRSVPSFIFLSSLAVSDLFVGIIVQPLYIASEITHGENSFLYDTSHVTAFAACGVSLCTMAVISVDRFLTLHYHMRYTTLVTKTRVVYTLVLIWLTDFLISVIYFESWKIFYIIVASGIVICFFISTVSYIRIYRVVRGHQIWIHECQITRQPSQRGFHGHLKMIRLKKSAMNTFVFYVFMILCYGPKCASLVVVSFFPEKWTNIWIFASTLVFYNSSINPVLYCWRIRELRTAVIKWIKKTFLRSAVKEN